MMGGTDSVVDHRVPRPARSRRRGCMNESVAIHAGGPRPAVSPVRVGEDA